LLDHNDTLAPFALDAAARVLASDTETDLLYSNEDKRAGTTDGPVASRQAHLFSWQLHHSRPAPAVAVRRHVDRGRGGWGGSLLLLFSVLVPVPAPVFETVGQTVPRQSRKLGGIVGIPLVCQERPTLFDEGLAFWTLRERRDRHRPSLADVRV